MNILKFSSYDNFKCIANKCKFTCCSGWDVNIDNNTFNKWSEYDNLSYLLKEVKKCSDKNEYFINKETHEDCPFLDNKGLCNIVKNHGEEYLSLTCHTFPRIENVFEDRKELSLSCACPEVVDIISNINEKIYIKSQNNSLDIKIRELLINIINEEDFSLEHKLIVSFEILLSILQNENLNLERYKDKEYIKDIVDMYKGVNLNIEESINELNNLFLDITQNYKEVPVLQGVLNDIYDLAQEVFIEDLSDGWEDFKDKFKEYNTLIQNCIVSKIFSSCVSSDKEEIIISFELIILEYLLIRYASFLKYIISEEISIQDIKDYIVVFSRVIGNNSEAVKEFIKEGFGDYILEVGYLCFIGLF